MKSPHVLTFENAKDALQDLFQARARPQHACVFFFFCTLRCLVLQHVQ
jgi:hypothetical protein